MDYTCNPADRQGKQYCFEAFSHLRQAGLMSLTFSIEILLSVLKYLIYRDIFGDRAHNNYECILSIYKDTWLLNVAKYNTSQKAKRNLQYFRATLRWIDTGSNPITQATGRATVDQNFADSVFVHIIFTNHFHLVCPMWYWGVYEWHDNWYHCSPFAWS